MATDTARKAKTKSNYYKTEVEEAKSDHNEKRTFISRIFNRNKNSSGATSCLKVMDIKCHHQKKFPNALTTFSLTLGVGLLKNCQQLTFALSL